MREPVVDHQRIRDGGDGGHHRSAGIGDDRRRNRGPPLRKSLPPRDHDAGGRTGARHPVRASRARSRSARHCPRRRAHLARASIGRGRPAPAFDAIGARPPGRLRPCACARTAGPFARRRGNAEGEKKLRPTRRSPCFPASRASRVRTYASSRHTRPFAILRRAGSCSASRRAASRAARNSNSRRCARRRACRRGTCASTDCKWSRAHT